MGRTACLQHPENEPMIVLHKWQSDMFEDACIGSLIAYFQYWHEIKLTHLPQSQRYNQIAEQHGDERSQDESLLQYHSQDEIEVDLLRIAKKSKIKQGVETLVEAGILSKHKNPVERYSFDRTTYYLFHVEILKGFLEARKLAKQEWSDLTGGKGIFDYSWVEYNSRSSESDSRTVISDSRSFKSDRTITETTSETSTKTTSEVFPESEEEFHPEPSEQLGHVKQEKGGDVAASHAESKKSQDKVSYGEEELQPFLDVFNQEKPSAWPKAEKLTRERISNLNLMINEYGEDSMSMFRRALLGARRDPWYSARKFKLEWLYRPQGSKGDNGNKIQGLAESVTLEEIDNPIAAHIQSPQDDKRARILERTARVAYNNHVGVVA